MLYIYTIPVKYKSITSLIISKEWKSTNICMLLPQLKMAMATITNEEPNLNVAEFLFPLEEFDEIVSSVLCPQISKAICV